MNPLDHIDFQLVVTLKNLIDAQRTTRNARLSLVQTKQSQYNAYVTLLQALGGSPIQRLP